MESEGEAASNTTIVEDIAANEEQNTSEEDVIRNRLTKLEENQHKLTEHEGKLQQIQDQMTENETKVFKKLSELTEKVDSLTEDMCRNSDIKKSKKNEILINKRGAMVRFKNAIEIHRNPEGEAANEEQNTSEVDIIPNRLTNVEATLHKLREHEKTLLQKQDQMRENETKLFKRVFELTERVDELTDANSSNNDTKKSKKNDILINKKETMVSLNDPIEVERNSEGDGQAGRRHVFPFTLEEKPRWKY